MLKNSKRPLTALVAIGLLGWLGSAPSQAQVKQSTGCPPRAKVFSFVNIKTTPGPVYTFRLVFSVQLEIAGDVSVSLYGGAGTGEKTFYTSGRHSWTFSMKPDIERGPTELAEITTDCDHSVGVVAKLHPPGWRTPSSTPKRQPLYMSLGDSYSALVPGTKLTAPCQRNSSAWPTEVAKKKGWRLNNIACSGAHTYDLTRSYRGQNSQTEVATDRHPDVVTLTIGGNDLNFGRSLLYCYLLDCGSNGWLKKKLAEIEALEPKLVALFSRLRWALPTAKIVAVGYPYLFPQRQPKGHHLCGWLEPGERQNLNKLTDALDREEAAAAAQAGIKHVSVLDALAGHELCTTDSWVYAVGKLPTYADGHVLSEGQHRIAQEVIREIG